MKIVPRSRRESRPGRKPGPLFRGRTAVPPRFAMGLFPPETEGEREDRFVRALRDGLERVRDDEVTLNEARAILEALRAMGRRGNPRPVADALLTGGL